MATNDEFRCLIRLLADMPVHVMQIILEYGNEEDLAWHDRLWDIINSVPEEEYMGKVKECLFEETEADNEVLPPEYQQHLDNGPVELDRETIEHILSAGENLLHNDVTD